MDRKHQELFGLFGIGFDGQLGHSRIELATGSLDYAADAAVTPDVPGIHGERVPGPSCDLYLLSAHLSGDGNSLLLQATQTTKPTFDSLRIRACDLDAVL